MAQFFDLNLIRLFDFYLASLFLISIFMRLRQYDAVVRLVRAFPDRWPKLMQLVGHHRNIFLTWTTLLPGILALLLTFINMLACRLIWPNADLTLNDLSHAWFAAVCVALAAAAMLVVDYYATFTVGKLDRPLLEGYFDQAEYWLRSWAAPVVRVFTLGYINPRRMVHEEVRKSLLMASKLLNSTLWWVTVQVGVRILFGLSIWLSWAFT
jgi:hypothetical protein